MLNLKTCFYLAVFSDSRQEVRVAGDSNAREVQCEFILEPVVIREGYGLLRLFTT